MPPRIVIKIFSLFFLLSVAVSLTCFAQSPDPATLASVLQKRLRNPQAHQYVTCADEPLCGALLIPSLYHARDYMPLWIRGEAFPDRLRAIIYEISTSDRDGLRPNDYHLKTLNHFIDDLNMQEAHGKLPETSILADMELLLTDSFLMYAAHISSGRINPETIHAKWFPANHDNDFTSMLETAAETNDIQSVCQSLRPPHNGYEALKNELQRLRNIAPKEPLTAIRMDHVIKQGDMHPAISSLKARLRLLGDLSAENHSAEDDDIFDASLATAVRRFQRRHGLYVDGQVGQHTLDAMNRPLSDRIRQIELNLERWRWIPRYLGQRYLLINIADFRLSAIENDTQQLTMRVVVGKTYRKTPVFSGIMKYLVLNPQWHVPAKIAVIDILPKIKKDPRFLTQGGYTLFEGWQEGAPEVAPEAIDWSQISEYNFSFKLMQQAGPQNVLGRIKFMFPNKFAVYLHDSPQRNLFQRLKRNYSSGCIRVEKAVELAAYLLSGQQMWDRDKIEEMITTGERKVILLDRRIPVHILYWTAWVSSDGLLHFRDDIYDRDRPLHNALQEKPEISQLF